MASLEKAGKGCPMKSKILLAAVTVFLALRPSFTFAAVSAPSNRVRIGVDMRQGFQACMDSWSPVAKYLSKAVPNRRFVVVPLASRQDIVRTLEKGDVDFIVLDPAMEIVANDRFFATPLLTMAETNHGETRPLPTDAACSGTLIRRVDRSDINRVEDIRGLRLSAVKPWSLCGWIAQWGLLAEHGIDPQTNLKQVVFEGTNVQVVKSVLSGAADIGAVDTQMLWHLIHSEQIPDNSLCFINREGIAVPLVAKGDISSTDTYPGRVLCKAKGTPDQLAQAVVAALQKQDVAFSLDRIPYQIRWSIACNDGKVRGLLQNLMGPYYAESPGYPLPSRYPEWLLPVLLVAMAMLLLAVVFLLLRRRSNRRETMLREQLQDRERELVEVRADRQRISAILSLADCGIDIVDDENQIVYADSSLEREYGDWHGRKCHEYFCGSNAPCAGCRRPFPINERCPTVIDVDCADTAQGGDSDAESRCGRGKSMRMIGVPFCDEGGRWLYARIHFPASAFAEPYASSTAGHV